MNQICKIISLIILLGFSTANFASAQDVIVEIDPCATVQMSDKKDYSNSAEYNPENYESPDLYGSQIVKPPQKIEFPLTYDISKIMGIELPPSAEGLTQLGLIRIENGQVFWNDEKISNDALVDLESFCQNKKNGL